LYKLVTHFIQSPLFTHASSLGVYYVYVKKKFLLATKKNGNLAQRGISFPDHIWWGLALPMEFWNVMRLFFKILLESIKIILKLMKSSKAG